MLNYSQRYLRHHRYITNAVEDFLAVSVCLPLTIALFCWNSIADLMTEANIFPEGADTLFWKIGRYLLNLPLYTFKGFVALTIAPLLASILAVRTTEPPIYKFNFGRAFQILALNYIVRFFTISSLPVLFNNIIFFLGLALYGLGRLLKSERYKYQFFALAVIFFNIDTTLSLLSITLPYFALTAQLLMMLSTPYLLTIGITMSFAILEGHLAKISEWSANLINSLIGTVQMWLFKVKIITFKNKEEAGSFEEIQNIPYENLFVSNNNYAFDLSELERGVEFRGLENYNAPLEEGRSSRLEWEDVLKLEQVPQLTTRFPKLATFIRDHKNDFKPSFNGKISLNTILALRKLAKALLISQSADPTHFAEQIVQEKESFDDYMNSLSREAKNHLEELNLLGGSDPDYTFKNIFEKSFIPQSQGGWCKKGASRLITETCDRLQTQGEDHNFVAFWQRPAPTHWLGIHARFG